MSAYPSVAEYRAMLARMYDELAGLLRAFHLEEEAETAYREALVQQERLVTQRPDLIEFRFDHGRVLHNLGNLLHERGRPREGLQLEREAIRRLEVLYQSDVKNPFLRSTISDAYWTLAAILIDLEDHRTAADSLADYLGIEPNGFEESLEAARFLCRCTSICREDSGISVSDRQATERAYADRALEALGMAVRNGYRDVSLLLTDSIYEPIRNRSEFGRLIREIEAMARAG